MENHPSRNWKWNSQKIELILYKILKKSYLLKFSRAGEQAWDLLLSLNLLSNTLPLSHSSSLYQGKFYKGPEYNIFSTRLNSPTS